MKAFSARLDSHSKQLCILLGDCDREEEEVIPIPKINLEDYIPLTGHALIVGQTGSGKSNVLMTQIINRLEANQELHILDVKRELGPIFKRQANIYKIEQATELFQDLYDLADKRMELFAQISEQKRKPCRNAEEYRKLTGEKLPTVCLIVEELIVLMSEINADDITKLLVVGRAAEVFVVVASQYMKADILPRKAIVNFTTKVFLGQYDRIAVQLVFDSLDKENHSIIQEHVGNPGRAAIQIGSKLSMAIMPRIEDYHLERYM